MKIKNKKNKSYDEYYVLYNPTTHNFLQSTGMFAKTYMGVKEFQSQDEVISSTDYEIMKSYKSKYIELEDWRIVQVREKIKRVQKFTMIE